MGMRLAVMSVCPQIRQGAGKSTAATASTAFRMITEALLTERARRDATPIAQASEEIKLRTQIYAANCGVDFMWEDRRIRVAKPESSEKTYTRPCSIFSLQGGHTPAKGT